MPNQTIIVTGSSGLVGTPLVASLQAQQDKVIRAVRRPIENPAAELRWDPASGQIDADHFEEADVVVHLAGENIAGKRWTESFKKQILDSRVEGTQLVSSAIANAQKKPHTFVCASAIGYYGDRGDEVLTEASSPGDDFLADVCVAWENACQEARDAGVRVVNLRIGVVLSRKGGALKSMLTPFKLGMGGVLGSGKQYMSWIELNDLARIIVHAVNTSQLSGPVNAVAPNAVTNREFTKALGRVLGRPTIVPMPAFAARLLFGEMADALLLASTRVAPKGLVESGFEFHDGAIDSALRAAVAN